MRASLLVCVAALASPWPAAAAGPVVIHTFLTSTDGGGFRSGLIRDAHGALYGVGQAGPGLTSRGVVYRLSPPAAGQASWVYETLYIFQGGRDGADPTGNLVIDASGALYGTTELGGSDKGVCARLNSGCGTVFKLTPPAPGQSVWTKATLHIFHGSDGYEPLGGLLLRPDGSLYGTASGGAFGYGVVFRLQPPDAGHASWHGSLLYNFTGGPDGAYPETLTFDGHGGLIGSTIDGGAFGLNCNNFSCGTVFRLSPPAAGETSWAETVLYNFSGYEDGGFPIGKLSLDSNGVIYGTATVSGLFVGNCIFGCGLVFSLSPPVNGQDSWTYTDLHSFDYADGAEPSGGIIIGEGGNLYGGTQIGGPPDPVALYGCGTLFGLAPPAAGQTEWPITFLASPPNCTLGASVDYAPLLAADGALYYVTIAGPFTVSGAQGTVLRVQPRLLQ